MVLIWHEFVANLGRLGCILEGQESIQFGMKKVIKCSVSESLYNQFLAEAKRRDLGLPTCVVQMARELLIQKEFSASNPSAAPEPEVAQMIREAQDRIPDVDEDAEVQKMMAAAHAGYGDGTA